MNRIRSHRIRKRSLALTILLAAGLCGCSASMRERRGIGSGDPAGRISVPSFSPPAFQRMRALYRSTLFEGGKRRSFRQILAVEPPGRLRMEILGPFGNPRLVLAVSGGNAVGFFPREGYYFKEPDSSRVFQSLLGMEIPATDLLSLMTGDLFYPNDGTRIESPTLAPEGWRVLAAGGPSGLRYEILLDLRTGDVREVSLFREGEGGDPVLLVRYPPTKRKNRWSVPRRMEVIIPASGIRIVNVLQHVQIDGPEFSRELFHPEIPPSYRLIDLQEFGGEFLWFTAPR